MASPGMNTTKLPVFFNDEKSAIFVLVDELSDCFSSLSLPEKTVTFKLVEVM